MQPLDYFLPRPTYDPSAAKEAAFLDLLNQTPPGSFVDYGLPYPKWEFLSYLCSARDLVLHGSQHADIQIVEPRKAVDMKAFSDQEAIYATTDGIWVIFFAIVDRKRFAHLSLFNSCMEVRLSAEHQIGPLYFFSITHSALVQSPWTDGVIYILPRKDFTREPAQQMMGAEITFPHWVSHTPAQPAAKIHVGPEDFPFLAQVHGHDDEILVRLATEDPNGFPWPASLIT